MDGRVRVCGLTTNPVERSTSPLMHNFYARWTEVNLAYAPFKVENEQVRDAVKGVFAPNILGMNVAVPHKQGVVEFLIDIDGDAKAIGAVNTLMRTEHGCKGYNTDATGLTRTLLGTGIHVDGEGCILIDTGDAAKAAVYTLARERTAPIYIMDRNLDRAQELAECINRLVGQNPVSTLSLDGYESIPQEKGRYLAIQPTSVGIHPHVGDVIVKDRYFYRLIRTGVDIVYTPAKTRFMELMEGAGGKAVSGLDMLLCQGTIVHELWSPQVRVGEETISMTRQLIRDHPSMPQAKHNLILVGFTGAGETSVGDCYAGEYGLPIVDTDQRIETAADMAISKIFATQGEEAFRKLEMGALEELLAHTDYSIISVGGELPSREENRILLKKLSCIVYLGVSPETVMGRIGRDVSDRPMLQGGDVESKIRGLLAMRRPVYLEASHVTVDINGRNVEEIVEEIHCRARIQLYFGEVCTAGKKNLENAVYIVQDIKG